MQIKIIFFFIISCFLSSIDLCADQNNHVDNLDNISDNRLDNSSDNHYSDNSDNKSNNSYDNNSDNHYSDSSDNKSNNSYDNNSDNNYSNSLDNNSTNSYDNNSDNNYSNSLDNKSTNSYDNNYSNSLNNSSINNYDNNSDNNYSNSLNNSSINNYDNNSYTEYVSDLIVYSEDKKLYNAREWDVLMLYKGNIFISKRSLVDDPTFFLSKDGKKDSKSELEATIKAMFEPNSDNLTDDNNHAQCRFPARKRFIVENLDIDITKMPQVECSEYKEFMSQLDPTSLTLVFPFLYIENPASVFGHTLLRINGKNNDPLLAYGITYAAIDADKINKFVMMVGGFVGYLEGYFTVKKYYVTAFEYSNIDRRDAWEYDLNFTEAEVKKLADHLWEVQFAKIDYFFLDENCSYHLLLLLESARPELRLANSTVLEVPSNSVRVIKDNNLISDVHFRPSHTKVLESIISTLPDDAIDIAYDVAAGDKDIQSITDSDYSDKIKASMIDLAFEKYRFGIITDEGQSATIEEYKKKSMGILTARSKYQLKTEYDVADGTRPEDGHNPTRLLFGFGAIDDSIYTELSLRATFHSLEDIDTGFIPNSQIVILDGTIQYNITDNYFRFKEITLLSFGAYIPMTRLRKTISFRIDVGGEDRRYRDYDRYFTPYVSGGVGVTFKFHKNIYLFLMSDIDLSFGKPYEYYVGLGLGANAGLSFSYSYIKLLLTAKYLIYPFNSPTAANGYAQTGSLGGSITLPVTRNNSIILEYERSVEWNRYLSNISLKWAFFF